MKKAPINIAIIGLGNRGKRYLDWILGHPGEARVAAVVDPDPVRLEEVAARCPSALLFRDHAAFSSAPSAVADAVVVSCPDRLHHEIAMAAIGKGMHVLLEKPMGTTPEECRDIAETALRKGVIVSVCYELHHHPYYLKLHELLKMPRMGRLIAATHTVNSGIDRSLHNFVRGGWSVRSKAGPTFLSKCSHDVDLFLWLCGEKVKEFSTSGSLGFFCEQNAPEGSTPRCIDCPLEMGCAFSAVNFYRRGKSSWTKYIARQDGETMQEAVERELREGPLGRCAFRCDNDVFDHQMLLLTTESGATISIFMNFLTREDSRVSYLSCSGGEIWADWKTLRYRFFNEDKIHSIDFTDVLSEPFHAGSDFDLIACFVSAVRDGTPLHGTSAQEALASHLICL